MRIRRRHTQRRPLSAAVTALSAPVLVLAGLVPSAAAVPAQAAGVSAPATTCVGGLAPVAVDTPMGLDGPLGDANSDQSVWLITSGKTLLHGPASGPLTGVDIPVDRFEPAVGIRAIGDGEVVVPGRIPKVQGVTQDAVTVVRTDGHTFTQMPLPTLFPVGGFNVVQSIEATSASDIWLQVAHWQGQTATYKLMHWDGSTWTRVTVPHSTPQVPVNLSLAGPGSVLVGVRGQAGILRYQDGHWHRVASPPGTDNQMTMLETPQHGHPILLTSTDGIPGYHIARWSSGTWEAVPPIPDTSEYAVNYFGIRNAPDGTTWAPYGHAFGIDNVQAGGTAVFDHGRWVQSGDLLGSDVQPQRGVNFSFSLLPVSSTRTLARAATVTAAGTTLTALGVSCGPVVTAAEVLRPRVTTTVGSPVAVLARSLPSPATLTDDLGLLAPVTLASGSEAQLRYPWAGTFTVSADGGRGSLTVGTSPAVEWVPDRWFSSKLHEQLAWATAPAPTGWHFAVEQQGPGDSRFRPLLTSTTESSVALKKVTSPGTWAYRARLVRDDGATGSDWSPVVVRDRVPR